MTDPRDIIRAHIPNLDTKAEAVIEDRYERTLSRPDYLGYELGDYADYAYRTCTCGAPIDGFYEYANHLIAELGEPNA